MTYISSRMTSHSLITTRTLLTIHLEFPETKEWRVRTVLLRSEEIPTQEDIQEYYSGLLGIQGCEVTTVGRIVPESFELDLIGSLALEAPEAWPHMDKTFTNRVEFDQYNLLLDRVTEIEYMRLNCGVKKGKKSTVSLADRILVEAKAKEAAKEAQTKAAKRDAWFRSIMESLYAASDAEHDNPSDIEDSDTIAWLFTPLHKDTRHELGYRIVMDREFGTKWATRVGSSNLSTLYPDVAICRRISSIRWTQSSENSMSLVHQIMKWYMQMQTAGTEETTISPWIPNAVFEVDRMLEPFRGIEHARGTPATEFSVPQFIQRMEDTHLFPVEGAEVPVYELSEKEWMAYIYHLLKYATRGVLDFRRCEDYVASRVREWMVERRGIRLEGAPFFPRWAPLWERIMLVTTDAPAVRFNFFMQTLDANDPVRQYHMGEASMRTFATSWINVFIRMEVERDPKMCACIYEEPLLHIVQSWIYQFVPEHFIRPYIKSALVVKLMNLSGFQTKKSAEGRNVFHAAMYKHQTAIEQLMGGIYDQSKLMHMKYVLQSTKKTGKHSLVLSGANSTPVPTRMPPGFMELEGVVAEQPVTKGTKTKAAKTTNTAKATAATTATTTTTTTTTTTATTATTPTPPTLKIEEGNTIHMGSL